MPLDILPAPTAPAGAAPPGPPGAASTSPLTGADALLFGLLLAQTTAQTGPKAAPTTAQDAATPLTAPASETTKTVAETTAPVPSFDKKNTEKAKDRLPATAPTAPVLTWTSPAMLPATQAARSPSVNAKGAAAARPADATIEPGRVMDTVPERVGELLSPPQTAAPVNQAVASPSDFSAVTAVNPPAESAHSILPPAGTPVLPPAAPPSPVRHTEPMVVSAGPAASAAPRVARTPGQALPEPPASRTTVNASSEPGVPSKPPVSSEVLAPESFPPATSTPSTTAPVSLQNHATPADNQAGKSAVSKPPGASVASAAAGKGTALEVTAPQSLPDTSGPVQEPPKDHFDSASGGKSPAPQTPAPAPQVTPVATPSQGVTPMPPTDRAHILGQVEQGLTAMTVKAGASGPQQVTLQLHPKDWGQLRVSVTMTPTVATDGKVSTQVMAHVIAEHPSVKTALETGQTDLRHSLREAGLHLDRLTVTVQAPAAGSGANAGGERPQSRSAEGWSGGQSAPPGAGAQGGAAFGGSHSSSAAFAQGGQPDRRPPTSPYAAPPAPADLELEDASTSVMTRAGRVDTRA